MGTSLYKSYRCAAPKGMIFSCFGLITGRDFAILVWTRIKVSREVRCCINIFCRLVLNE